MSIKIYKDGKWQILPGQGSPGKSAYDYASENGFVGSEEDFANALGSIDDIANKIENIDTTPTEGSNNLVTSGGVKKALVDLSISENVVLSNQLNEVEANITALYGRTDDNYDNINKILDILKGEEKWPDDWVPGDSAGGSGTVDVEKLKETFDNRYLVKVADSEQSVNNDVTFNKQTIFNGITTFENKSQFKGELDVDNNIKLKSDGDTFAGIYTDDFNSGGFDGSGLGIYTLSEDTGDLKAKSSVIEVDKLYVRKEAHFNELVINQIRFTRGATVFSHGGATITNVVKDEINGYYRCYYNYDPVNQPLKHGFKVGDLARCQRFDEVVEGFNKGASSRYYWREVVGVGDDYFDLSINNCDGSSEPAIGDDVCQFGNITDVSRQSAIVIDPQLGGSIWVYNKIGQPDEYGNVFTLSEKNFVGIGTENGESFIRGYDINLYLGDRNETSYLKYDENGITLKGNLAIGTDLKGTTINGESLSDKLSDLVNKIKDFDGVVDTFVGTNEQMLEKATLWKSEGSEIEHAGDLFLNTTDNKGYRWAKNSDDIYEWVEDSQIQSLYGYVDDKIDGEKKIFAGDDVPENAKENDLWLKGDAVYVYRGNEWIKVVEYESTDLTDIEAQIKELEGKIGPDKSLNFYFGEDPYKLSDQWDDVQKEANVGDLFYDSKEDKAWQWTKIDNNYEWTETNDYKGLLKKISDTEASVDGAIKTFVNTYPTLPYGEGDLWLNGSQLYICIKVPESDIDFENDNYSSYWIASSDTSVDYLKSAFKQYTDLDGILLSKMVAVKDENDAVVAGMYGTSEQEISSLIGKDENGNSRTRMIFAGAKDFPGEDASFNTSIWSDGHLETNSFALNSGKVSISENDIIIGSENTDGQITLGFDNVDGKEIPYLKYSGGSVNNAWDLRNALFTTEKNGEYTVDIGEGSIKYESGVWKFDGDLLVSGGVSFYTPLSTDVSDVQSIYWNYLPVDEYFNTTDGTLRLNVDKLSSIGGSGGVDESVLENYYTKTEVDNLIAGGSDGEINLDGYVSRDAFPELFNTNFNTSIAGYLKSTDAESTYATKDSLNNYLTTESANNYALKNDLETYLTKSDAQSTYATIIEFNEFKSDVSNTYAIKLDLNTHVAAFNEHKTAFEKFKTDISKDFNSDNITANSSLVSNNGLTVNNKKLTCTNGVWQLDGDLLVTGGVSFYSSLDSGAFSTLVDYIESGAYITKSNNVLGIDYDSLYVAIKASLIEDDFSAGSGSIDTSSFALKTDVDDLRSDYNNFLKGSDSDTIINKWSELEDFLDGLTESNDLSTILSNKADKTSVPTKISDLYDDSGFLTSITKSMITTALGYTPYNSTNPNGYITSSSLTGYAKTSSLAAVATSGSYNDLSNKPFIPTYSAGTGISISSGAISIKTASNTLGGVKTTSNVTSASGLTACPIINGVVYYKDTNTTYTIDNTVTGAIMNTSNRLYLIGVQSRNTSIKSESSSIYMQGGELTADTFVGNLDGNAKTATSLATARTIWGQSFNGNANISGDMTGVGNITLQGTTRTKDFGSDGNSIRTLYTRSISCDSTWDMVFCAGDQSSIDHSNSANYNNARMIIGGKTAIVKMMVNTSIEGNLTVSGGITFYSQKSLKNIHETDFLSLDQLSNIHAIKYTWKDGRDDRMHVGGIADDIQKIIPEVIYENDGYLTMDYGNAGFVIGTSLIKPVVDHEKRIKELEEEVARLNNLLNA